MVYYVPHAVSFSIYYSHYIKFNNYFKQYDITLIFQYTILSKAPVYGKYSQVFTTTFSLTHLHAL